MFNINFESSSIDPNKEYIEMINDFGLNQEEAIVYLSLLKRGKRGEIVGRIKNELEIGRTTIYGIMERLLKNGWIYSEEISKSPKRVKYVAIPPYKNLNTIIKKKEDELIKLKNESLFIGDKLDIIYQGSRNLTIDTIHIGGYKYIKPLVELGWKIKTEVVEHEDTPEVLVLDYELKGKKGFPKDCGLIITIHKDNIENNKELIEETLNIFKKKSEYEIRNHKIPGFEDLKFEDVFYKNYFIINIFIKLKFKKKWWLVGNEAVIPIKNRLFLIHGNKENFQILFDTIQNLENFRHLV
ncbi:MAG: hypothetical protein JXA99_05865 [Candidatus Lokiarchaeota archaeon]|nr:hypothetical protein [Candidatus Lokiarchaeota archaeon]